MVQTRTTMSIAGETVWKKTLKRGSLNLRPGSREDGPRSSARVSGKRSAIPRKQMAAVAILLQSVIADAIQVKKVSATVARGLP